jgi:hypothetical protein
MGEENAINLNGKAFEKLTRAKTGGGNLSDVVIRLTCRWGHALSCLKPRSRACLISFHRAFERREQVPDGPQDESVRTQLDFQGLGLLIRVLPQKGTPFGSRRRHHRACSLSSSLLPTLLEPLAGQLQQIRHLNFLYQGVKSDEIHLLP